MPRANKSKATADKHLRQKSLFDFAGSSSTAKHAGPSSKATMTAKSSPARPSNTSSKRKRRRAASVDADDGTGSSSDVAAIHFEPRPAIEILDSDEDVPAPPRRLRKQKDRAVTSSPNPVESQDSDLDMDMIPSPPTKKRLVKKAAMATLSDESDSDVVPAPKKRKLAKGKRPVSPHLYDDSGDEVDEAQILDARLRKRGKKSDFQKNLEKLKKKRGRQEVETSSEEGEEDSDEEGKDEEPAPFLGARRDGTEDIEEGTSHQSREDEDEDDFIVEDDAAATDLPVAFSMTARQDPAHLFKIVCQLFVHLAVRPVNERHDYMEHILKSEGTSEKYFAVPLIMTRNKLSGLRDSVASSVWRPSLKKALLTLPDFSLSHLDFAVPHCDACHLGGRMSTFMGQASGQPYDRLSFEPVQKHTDSDDSEDSEESLADEAKEFNLGRFCAARVQVFHRFAHWEYTLFDAIKTEMNQLRGGGNFVRVGFWKGMQPPEDLSDADGIMDWLDQRGFVQMEWQRIKEMMNSASKLEGGREDDQELDLS